SCPDGFYCCCCLVEAILVEGANGNVAVRHIWHDIKLLAATDARHIEGDAPEHGIQVMDGDHFMRQLDDSRTPLVRLSSGVGGYTLDFQDIPVRAFACVGDDFGGA